MAVNLYNQVVELVECEGLDIEDFQMVTAYLLENGVICREDSEKEKHYYDYFVRLETIIIDYLNLININIVRDEDLESIRLYAPSSPTPQNFQADDVRSNMSMGFNSEESAYLIALALLYHEKLKQGEIENDATIEVDMVGFNIALATIGVTASENKTVREEAFKTLQRIRVVKFASGVLIDEDKPLIVRPYINQIVLPDMIQPFINIKESDNEN